MESRYGVAGWPVAQTMPASGRTAEPQAKWRSVRSRARVILNEQREKLCRSLNTDLKAALRASALRASPNALKAHAWQKRAGQWRRRARGAGGEEAQALGQQEAGQGSESEAWFQSVALVALAERDLMAQARHGALALTLALAPTLTLTPTPTSTPTLTLTPTPTLIPTLTLTLTPTPTPHPYPGA